MKVGEGEREMMREGERQSLITWKTAGCRKYQMYTKGENSGDRQI